MTKLSGWPRYWLRLILIPEDKATEPGLGDDALLNKLVKTN